LVKPYLELKVRNGKIRVFRDSVNEEDLIWHRDKKDRTLIVLEGFGWQLQLDNEEPKDLLEGHSYSIDKMEYHRIIKGTGDLVVRIYE
jgi:hypothetical protein